MSNKIQDFSYDFDSSVREEMEKIIKKHGITSMKLTVDKSKGDAYIYVMHYTDGETKVYSSIEKG